MTDRVHAPDTGLGGLVKMTMVQLTAVDDATLDDVVEKVVGQTGPWDRLWDRGDKRCAP
jgi:hypothetical protein